jgi:hypothetical protein
MYGQVPDFQAWNGSCVDVHSTFGGDDSMRTLYSKLSAAALTLFTASVSFAGNAPPTHVSEPGMLELAGLGLAVAIAVSLRKRK